MVLSEGQAAGSPDDFKLFSHPFNYSLTIYNQMALMLAQVAGLRKPSSLLLPK